MAEAKTVTMNKPGWLDLSSRDPLASRKFYSDLFGWTVEVISDPTTGEYGMFKVDGKEVGGVGQVQNEQQPTAWTMYVLVADADDTVRRAREAGGTALMEPGDVVDQGRMAVLADPSGAVFGLWQPKAHAGWEAEGVPGSVCWVELMSREIGAATKFYQDVFGWIPETTDMGGGMRYTTYKLGEGQSFAGGMATPEMVPAEVPSHWRPYIAVTDADAVTAKAKELGATVLQEPADIPGTGRFSIVQDPLGAVFGLLQPAPTTAG